MRTACAVAVTAHPGPGPKEMAATSARLAALYPARLGIDGVKRGAGSRRRKCRSE